VRRVRWSSCGFARGWSRSRADRNALYPRSRYSACRVYGDRDSTVYICSRGCHIDRTSTGYVCSRGWHIDRAPCGPHIYRHPCGPHTDCVPRSSPVCRCHHNTTSAHSPAADRPLQRRRPRETCVVERAADAGADGIQTGGAGRARNDSAVSTTSTAANQCAGTTGGSAGSYHPLRPDRSRDTHATRNVDAPIGGYDAQGAAHPKTYGADTCVNGDTATHLHPRDDPPFQDAAGGRDVNADSDAHGGRPDRDRHHDAGRSNRHRHHDARGADHDHHDDDHARWADRDRLDHVRWPHGDRDHDARRPDRNRHDDEHAGWPYEDRDGIDHVRWPNAAYNEHAGSPTHDRDGDHDARWANADRLNNAYTGETDSNRHRHRHRHHRRHAAAVSPREHS